ncbi:MAG TPA: DUF4097 family beta strand repeat-containing protein [Xanthomonadaceae bacterium]|nr:DUF4097 family beta strand repeat-containing protein [Xanthomonadaceae bacterium]
MSYSRRVFAAALIALPAVAFAASTPISEMRPLNPDGEVLIDNTKGAIVVRVADQPEVRINGTLGDGVERLAIEGDRRHLRIRVINPQTKGWFGNWGGAQSGDTRLEITVPAHASVAVEGVSAVTDIKGVAGRRLSVNSVSGDVQVEASPGEARVESVSGDLHMHLDTSKTHVETVNGNVDLQGRINGEVSVETLSGHIVLRADKPSDVDVSAVSGDADLRTGLAAGGQLKAESTSGDLSLTLPATSSAQLQLNSYNGAIHSDSGNVVSPEHGPGASLKTKIGRGDASITLESFSGDVRVKLEGSPKLD